MGREDCLKDEVSPLEKDFTFLTVFSLTTVAFSTCELLLANRGGEGVEGGKVGVSGQTMEAESEDFKLTKEAVRLQALCKILISTLGEKAAVIFA